MAATRRARLPLLGGLAWLAAIGGLLQVLTAIAWHDGLAPTTPALLALHLAAFMCQTFAFHAGIAMLPVAAIAAWSRRWRLVGLATVVFLLGAGPELPRFLPGAPPGPSESLTIMSVNLMYGRGDPDALLAQIARERPDVLVFQEWTPSAAAQLHARLAAVFPHCNEQPRDDAFGQAVFSKLEFAAEVKPFPPVKGFSEPQVSFAVSMAGKPLRITDVHLLPPVGRSYFAQQRLCASAYGRWVRDAVRPDRPDVLVGDFNATRRSAIVGDLLAAGMRDAHAEAGLGRGSTWPRVGALAHVPGLQLDHALLGPRLRCVESRVGEDFGSDHRPVIVHVRWAE